MRKLLALILALALVISIVPFTALAAENGESDESSVTGEPSEPPADEEEPEEVVEPSEPNEPDEPKDEPEEQPDVEEPSDDEAEDFENVAPVMAPMVLAAPAAAGGQVDNFVGYDDAYAGDEYGWLTEGQLYAQDGSDDKNLGNGWKKYEINNPLNAATGEDDIYRVWKLEISGGQPQTAHLWFYNGAYYDCEITNFSTSGNGATCLVIMPDGYRLVGGCFNPASGINANYAGRHTPEHTGTVTVKATVDAWHNEITPYENYERDVDKYYERSVDEYYERSVDKYFERTVDEYYERTVDEFYERPVDEYYERTVDEYYVRPVTEIMQRYAQRYLIPVFEKKLAGAYKDTLVTRLDYTDNTAKATPTNGGAFKNGHTYVAVDVAAASSGDGVWFTIADSSKNNGKKAPDQYNRPIEYKYNVKIADGKLTVSFADDLAYASVGCEIWASAPKDAKNAPKHYANSVTVDVPSNKGSVDLYVHIEKLGWYDVDENGDFVYQFKEWRYDDSRTEYGDYELIDTVYGDYALADTVNGDYELVDTVNGEYELVNTVNGEYELVNTVEGDYELVDTVNGEYELVNTVNGEYELVNTVNGDYELVDSEEITERVADTVPVTWTIGEETYALGEEIELNAGEYTVTLTVNGEAYTQKITVVTGEDATVDFGTIEVQGDDVTLDVAKSYTDRDATEHFEDLEAEKYYADKEATEHYADKAATEYYADKTAEKHYADKEATKHYANKEAEKHYADAEATQQYNEDYLYRDDIKLGNETDPDGEYAVKLN